MWTATWLFSYHFPTRYLLCSPDKSQLLQLSLRMTVLGKSTIAIGILLRTGTKSLCVQSEQCKASFLSVRVGSVCPLLCFFSWFFFTYGAIFPVRWLFILVNMFVSQFIYFHVFFVLCKQKLSFGCFIGTIKLCDGRNGQRKYPGCAQWRTATSSLGSVLYVTIRRGVQLSWSITLPSPVSKQWRLLLIDS